MTIFQRVITTNEKHQKHVNWDKNTTDNYFCEFKNEEILHVHLGKKLDVLIESGKNINQEDVNDIVENFKSILLEAAHKLNMIKRKNKYIPNRNKKFWYTKECKIKKRDYYKVSKNHFTTKTTVILEKKQKKLLKCIRGNFGN